MFQKLRFSLIMLAIAMLPGLIFSQTVHQVAAGEGTLAAAIAAAAPGDILELTTDGGFYTNTSQVVIDSSIVIRAHEDLVVKPAIMYTGTSSSMYMIKLIGSPRVEFRGIEFAGDGTGQGASSIARSILLLDSEDTTSTMQLFIDDCILNNTGEKIVKVDSSCGVDSIVVTNTIFHGAGREGVTLYSGTGSDPAAAVRYTSFSNCTFYNIEREAIKAQSYEHGTVRVDHCTFYNCGSASQAKDAAYFSDVTDVVFKNSIIQLNRENDGSFLTFEDEATTVNNLIVWDVLSYNISGNPTVSDTLHADPMFADAASADFTLMAGSPALGYADDGHAAGDLRWDSEIDNPTVHQVEAGVGVLEAAIDAAAPGDIIELISSGGTYTISEHIVIDKSLIIRGRAELAQRPIIKNNDTDNLDYLFIINDAPRVEFINLDMDGTGAGGDVTNILRLDNAGFVAEDSTMELFVENCDLHGAVQKLIRPYSLSNIDSMVIHNSTFYDALQEGVMLSSSGSTDDPVYLDYAEIINCTFYDITREAIKAQSNADTRLLVDQCTFYNIGGLDKPFMFLNTMSDAVIKNSIFSTNLETGNFLRLFAGNTVNNIVFWDVFDHDIENTDSVTDTLYADPLFTDAENGDFTLLAGSPARTAGEGGLPTGDLRWAIDPNAVLLTIITSGSGIVELSPAGGIYDPGTVVTLTAVPDLGWEFSSWVGNVFPPNQNPINITMNSNQTVTAIFNNLTPQVTVEVDTIGLGHVTVSPEPVDGSYDQGTSITVTAVPQENWEFVEWLGDISGSENPTTFAADSNMSVIASFQSTLTQFELMVTVVGEGSVTQNPEPVIATYDTASVVELTATPILGWDFAGWTGDVVGTDNPLSIEMDSSISLTATFEETQYTSNSLEIDTSWSLYDAVELANNNSIIDTLVLTTSGGVYTSYNTEDVKVLKPLTIMAQAGLAEKPIITNSDIEAGNDDILRVYDDFALIGVIMDGGHELTHGMKYGIRLRNASPDTVKTGTNVTILDCDFVDFFENKSPTSDGHPYKQDINVVAGDVLFENCTFTNTGYEAIKVAETETFATDRALESLTVRNCTFTNIDAEAVRYYSDVNGETPDAPVILEHITINNSGTRVFYLKNSEGAIVRDIIIANSRTSPHGRNDDIMDAQGIGTVVSYIDTFNVAQVEIRSGDGGTIDSATIFGFDPQFVDPENLDYTLAEGSPAYGMAHDGSALGDLRWATNVTGLVYGEGVMPLEYKLNQNYPNPFNPSTTIEFSLIKAGMTKIVIYNILGAEVTTLINKELTSGIHKYVFSNPNLATGLYFYRLTSGKFTAIKKMLLVK